MHMIRNSEGLSKAKISGRMLKRFLPEMNGDFDEIEIVNRGKVRIFRITTDAILGSSAGDVETLLWVGDYIEL